MNMFWKPLDFEVPVDPRREWRVAIDTFTASADETANQTQNAVLGRSECTVRERSIVVLVGVEPESK